MKSLAGFGIAVALFVLSSIVPVKAQETFGQAAVVGTGSTFAYPIVYRWSKGYQRWVSGGGDIPIAGSGLDDAPTGPRLDYEPTG